MYSGPERHNFFNMNGGFLTPAAVQAALTNSGIRWAVPKAQYYAMQTWGLRNFVSLEAELKEDFVIPKKTEMTLLGLPIEMDNDLPETTMQLRHCEKVIYEIQYLAVPAGMFKI